jgi:hypothetical protein
LAVTVPSAAQATVEGRFVWTNLATPFPSKRRAGTTSLEPFGLSGTLSESPGFGQAFSPKYVIG